jgi:hypothetical protein
MTEPKCKTVCVKRFDADLYEKVKAQAEAEGILIRDWIEREIHELARTRKERVRSEADLSDSSR